METAQHHYEHIIHHEMGIDPNEVLGTRIDVYIDTRGDVFSIEDGFTGQNIKDVLNRLDRTFLYPCDTCRCLYRTPVRVNAYGTPTCKFCK